MRTFVNIGLTLKINLFLLTKDLGCILKRKAMTAKGINLMDYKNGLLMVVRFIFQNGVSPV
ncbi:hypothetical protein BC751_0679 [Cecembia calidifontis]|jgi:uncharacterized protein YkvS|uniref:Uncharacterized protein n=1 Tax=Cecembia calidifontis TaxID=1187080 RepID=A0A4Q7P561_9BACT|nr:hypothetical protein BC751_0679 [Cecembia calidifontis]